MREGKKEKVLRHLSTFKRLLSFVNGYFSSHISHLTSHIFSFDANFANLHNQNHYQSNFMNYAICTVSAAPVRKENAHRSEMVNQLLFGERMEVLEENQEWFRIRSVYDDYEGWLTNHLIA